MNSILALQKLNAAVNMTELDSTKSNCCNGSTYSVENCCND